MPFLLCLLEALSCNTQADTQQNRTSSMPWQLTAFLLPTLKVLKVSCLLFCSLKKIPSCALHQNMSLHNWDMMQALAEPCGQCWQTSVIPAVCSLLSYAEFMVWVAEQSNQGTYWTQFRDGRKRLIERYLLFSSVQMLAFCLMTTTWKKIFVLEKKKNAAKINCVYVLVETGGHSWR